jgi:putative addiction module component (TIGR02574 family)
MIEKIPELRKLSASEKLTLVTELWEDLASQPENIQITPEQIAEVDRRLEAYRQNPAVRSAMSALERMLLRFASSFAE